MTNCPPEAISQVGVCREPRLFRVAAWVTGAMLVTVIAVLVSIEGPPPVVLAIVLAVSMVVSENRDRVFGDETSVSGSIAVAATAIFAFHDSTPLLGPLVCASCAGLYWRHLVGHDVRKIVFNAGSIGFSALAGSGVLSALTAGAELGADTALIAAVPVLLAYWTVNALSLAIAASLLRRGGVFKLAAFLLRSEMRLLVFGIGGAMCGYVVAMHGVEVGVTMLIALVAVIDAVLLPSRKPGRPAPGVARTISILSLDLAALMALEFATRFSPLTALPVSMLGASLFATFASAFVFWVRIGRWDLRLAAGLVIAEWPNFVVAAAAGVLASVAGVLAAMVFAAAGFFAVWLFRRWLIGRREAGSPSDEELLDALEFALLERVDTTISSR